MEENNIDSQDVDLENNDSQPEGETPVESDNSEARIKELEAEVAKFRRIAAKSKKTEEKEVEAQPKAKEVRSNELDYGQLALLRTEGIKGSGETALFKEIMAETGKSVLEVLDSGYFKNRLNEFREAQASADAVPKGKNRTGQQSNTDVDYAFAKYKDTGELPQDFATRSKVVDLITKEEKGDLFSGPSVIKS